MPQPPANHCVNACGVSPKKSFSRVAISLGSDHQQRILVQRRPLPPVILRRPRIQQGIPLFTNKVRSRCASKPCSIKCRDKRDTRPLLKPVRSTSSLCVHSRSPWLNSVRTSREPLTENTSGSVTAGRKRCSLRLALDQHTFRPQPKSAVQVRATQSPLPAKPRQRRRNVRCDEQQRMRMLLLRQKFHIPRRQVQFELHGERDAPLVQNQFSNRINSPFATWLPFLPAPVQCRVLRPKGADGFAQLRFRDDGILFTHGLLFTAQ